METDTNTFAIPEFSGEFNMDDFEFVPRDIETPPARYCKPKIFNRKKTMAKYAEELADSIEITKNSSTYVFLSGRFIFGDFLYHLVERKNIHVLKMHVATLSMCEENIMRLAELMERDFIDSLDLHVSIYFYAHERHVMVPFIYKALDIGDRFQLVVSANHAKICLMETEGGKKIVIHGSANLRSSDNVEQIEITEDAELYDFNRDFLDNLTERYKTINKPVRGGQMPWRE